MSWIAITALVAWLAIVGVVRVVLRRRWEGTTFVALQWRRWTSAEWIAAVLGIVAVSGLVAGTLSDVLRVAWDPRVAASWFSVGPGLSVIALATALMVWAQLTMGASWRVGVDRDETTALVTTGPFRWARNPIYTAMVAYAAGLALMAPAVVTLVGAVAMVAFVEWEVRVVEEPYLVYRHGRAFLRWSSATGRFFPGLGRA